MGAAGTRTRATLGGRAQPRSAKSTFHFLPFLFGTCPRAAPTRSLCRGPRSGFSLGPVGRAGHSRARVPPRPFLPPGSPAGVPRELTCWGCGGEGGGQERFLLRRSPEHYGRARPRLGRQPQPPESGAGTGGGRERGARAGREARARSPRPDRRCRRRRAAMAERRAFAQKISR